MSATRIQFLVIDASTTPVSAAASVPSGAWAVGVSGGADSVALLRLLAARRDLRLHVVHLNHEARGTESAADSEFVKDLAAKLGLAGTVERLSDLSLTGIHLVKNRSARFRAARFNLFRSTVDAHGLAGVILAHHADDQAETVLHRLLRGSGPEGLAGMSPQARLRGLLVLRPLLAVNRQQLRQYLGEIDQTWREDASNASNEYARNRVRHFLSAFPQLSPDLLALGRACRDLRQFARRQAPRLPEIFSASALAMLPPVLARESARRWLSGRGCPERELGQRVIFRLLEMAEDAATPPRQQFPGNTRVCRRRGQISVLPSSEQSGF